MVTVWMLGLAGRLSDLSGHIATSVLHKTPMAIARISAPLDEKAQALILVES